MYPVPKWITDLAMRLTRWEDEHPASCDCEQTKARGLCLTELRQMIPADILLGARAVADYLSASKED